MENMQAILMRIKQAGSDALFIRLLLTVVAVLFLFFIMKMINGLARKISRDLDSWSATHIPPIKIQTFELISADRVTEILKAFVRAGRFVLWVIALYVFIPVVLSFFPGPREIVRTYLGYIIAPFYTILRGFLSFIPNLFFIGLVGLATRYVLKFTRLFFNEMGKGNITFSGFHQEWVQPTHKLLRLLIIVLAVVVVSPYLPGFGSPAFQGISIFFGVLLSLGSTAAIANIVAGLAITYMRPFKVGDRVKIADTMGDVIEKTLLITRVRTIKNVEVTIPNSMVLGSHMINYSALASEDGLILHTSITIGYDVPWRQVHELLVSAARSTLNILQEPPPFILQTGLNDYSVSYELNVYTAKAHNLLTILSELHQNIQDKFNEANIEIMSPSYAALRDGNQVTIPENYLPKSAPPKGFRILRAESQKTVPILNIEKSDND